MLGAERARSRQVAASGGWPKPTWSTTWAGDGTPGLVQDGPHVRLVDRHLQGLQAGSDDDAVVDQGTHDVQIHLLVIEGDHVDPIRQRAQVGLDQRRPDQHFGRDGARGIVRALGQHGDRQAEGAACLGGHPRQLAAADHPDVVGAQVASLGDRSISDPDMTGTLGEEP